MNVEHIGGWTEQDGKYLVSALWHCSNSISDGQSTDVRCDVTEWLKGLKLRLSSDREPYMARDVLMRILKRCVYRDAEGKRLALVPEDVLEDIEKLLEKQGQHE